MGQKRVLKISLAALKAAFSVAGVILLILIIYMLFGNSKNDFDSSESKLSYSQQRSQPKYSINYLNETDNYTTYKLVYESKSFLKQDGEIYALMYVPKSNLAKYPGCVFLPGGGVPKEDEPAAKAIAELGYVVLVIDQRGIGETGGFYPNFDEDKLLFESKGESIQHLGVYDLLRGVDILKNMENVDESKIIVGGASMGGRYAMIAAGIDTSINKAIIISSAGFHINGSIYGSETYFLSIDADRYVSSISPRKLVMIHSTTDSMITLEDAKFTYDIALEPKSFYIVENCSHGYCDAMKPYLEAELI